MFPITKLFVETVHEINIFIHQLSKRWSGAYKIVISVFGYNKYIDKKKFLLIFNFHKFLDIRNIFF